MTALPWPWRRPLSVTWRAGVARSAAPSRRTARAAHRAQLAASAYAGHASTVRAARLRRAWADAAEGAGLGQDVPDPIAGAHLRLPRLTGVREDGSLVVALLPGQLPGDVRAAGHRLAPWLDCAVVRVEELGPHHVLVRRLDVDPLADVRTLPDEARPSSSSAQVTGPLENGPARAAAPSFVAYAEDGTDLALSWQARPHMGVQGTTGSGKSVFSYGVLADAAGRPDVLVAGLDPSGLLLGRPFAGTRHEPWQVAGLTPDMAAHVALLERLVAEMDRRIAGLPEDQDNLVADEDQPILAVVLEEYAALLGHADGIGRDVGKRVRALVGRLLAEGRKAGVRVLLIVQRAEAAVVGAYARGQLAARVSFAVDTPAAVELFHPGAEDAAGHVGAPPGVALVTLPGRPLLRVRAGLLAGGYAEYVQRVRAAA